MLSADARRSKLLFWVSEWRGLNLLLRKICWLRKRVLGFSFDCQISDHLWQLHKQVQYTHMQRYKAIGLFCHFLMPKLVFLTLGQFQSTFNRSDWFSYNSIMLMLKIKTKEYSLALLRQRTLLKTKLSSLYQHHRSPPPAKNTSSPLKLSVQVQCSTVLCGETASVQHTWCSLIKKRVQKTYRV